MARKDKTNYPVVRTGRLYRPSPDPIGGNCEINIETLLSKVNRRLYRHGRTYTMKLDLDANTENAGQIEVFALADNWMNHKAFKMSFDMYMENSADERSRLKSSNIARWEDFRTRSGAGITSLSPLQYDQAFNAVALTAGEFNLTTVVDAAGVTRGFTWNDAANPSLYNILGEYDKAGNAQVSPESTTGDMPYDDLMSDDSAVMASKLQTNGDAPPYDQDGVLADSPWVKVGVLSAGGAALTGQRLSTGFFEAPCGFVILKTTVPGGVVQGNLQWTVKAGDYKGVHAPSMLE